MEMFWWGRRSNSSCIAHIHSPDCFPVMQSRSVDEAPDTHIPKPPQGPEDRIYISLAVSPSLLAWPASLCLVAASFSGSWPWTALHLCLLSHLFLLLQDPALVSGLSSGVTSLSHCHYLASRGSCALGSPLSECFSDTQ